MEFQSVDTVDAALERLSDAGDEVRVLAGGTDLVLQSQRGEVQVSQVLHIGPIDALRHITLDDEVVRIGALATHTALQVEPIVTRHFGALKEAAATVGGWQTQAAGTLGGNVCNASPAADTMPPLLVADAEVVLASAGGSRSLPVEDFVRGRREIDRSGDELVTGLNLPLPLARSGEVYLKVAPRGAMEVALVGLAMRLTFTAGGGVSKASVAVCSVGPRPFRAHPVEEILVAGLPDPEAVSAAGEMLASLASPIDDARATARYRRRILASLLSRAIDICKRRVGTP